MLSKCFLIVGVIIMGSWGSDFRKGPCGHKVGNSLSLLPGRPEREKSRLGTGREDKCSLTYSSIFPGRPEKEESRLGTGRKDSRQE